MAWGSFVSGSGGIEPQSFRYPRLTGFLNALPLSYVPKLSCRPKLSHYTTIRSNSSNGL